MVAVSKGPRYALLCGAFFFLFGYGGMYLSLSSTLKCVRGPVLAAVFWLLGGMGSGFVYNATVFTNSQNFSATLRGPIIGLLSTLFGASSTMWIIILNGCLGGNPVKDNTGRFVCGSPGWIGG